MAMIIVSPQGDTPTAAPIGALLLEPLEALRYLWDHPGPHQVVVRFPSTTWLLTGDLSVEIDKETAFTSDLLRSERVATERASMLLERSEFTDTVEVRLARYLGFDDDRLVRWHSESASGVLEQQIRLAEQSPLATHYPDALSSVAPRWTLATPIFELLGLLADKEQSSTLRAELNRWKKSLLPSAPLWLHCRILKASSHLYRLAGDAGKASYEEDLLRSFLVKMPADSIRTALLSDFEPLKFASDSEVRVGDGSSREILLRCLGSPRIECGNGVVSAKAWRTQKSISLFFYLALQRRLLSADHLQEVIWPGLGYESGANFLTTISRVRKALSTVGLADVMVRRQGRLYEIASDYLVRTDMEEFETKARSLGARSFDLVAARATLDLYQGPFLEGLEDLWVVQARRPLQELWFDLAIRTAEAELSQGEPDRAYQLCGRMLKLEGAREEAHLCQIKTLLAIGRFSDAQEAYQSFEKVVRKSTGQALSDSVQSTYRALRQSARLSYGRTS